MSFIIQPQTASTVGTISGTTTAAVVKGKPVTLNSDGTLTQSGITGYAINTFTTPVSASTNIGTNVWMGPIFAFDSVNGKYVYIFPQTSTNYVMCCVGTLSGTTVTWGTATVLISAYCANANIIFTTSGKFVVTGYYVDVISAVVSISGTTPTVGTPTTVESGAYSTSPNSGTSCFDSVNNKVFIAYQNSSAYQVKSYVGTISGTTISFGTRVLITGNITGGDNTYQGCAFNVNDGKVVVQVANSTTPAIYIYSGVISGTTITYGTSPLIFGTYGYPAAVYEPKYKKVIMSVSQARISIINTTGADPVEDGLASAGTINFQQAYSSYTVDTTKNLIYLIGNINFSQPSAFIFKILEMTSATTLTVNSTTTVSATANSYPQMYGIVFDSTNSKVVIAAPSTASYLTQVYYQVGYGDISNYTGFIGFSSSDYTTGQTATIETIGNIDSNQSGLTPASKYYVQTHGTLSTTPAATSVYAGTAISATLILIKGQP